MLLKSSEKKSCFFVSDKKSFFTHNHNISLERFEVAIYKLLIVFTFVFEAFKTFFT